MSRIGTGFIVLPSNFRIKQITTMNGIFLCIIGYYKKYIFKLPKEFYYYLFNNFLFLKPYSSDKKLVKRLNQLWGLYFKKVESFCLGLNLGVFVILELRGVGFRLKIEKNKILFFLGFSHVKEFQLPVDIFGKILDKKATTLQLFGFNKQKVTQIAAQIKLLKIPDLYKGKGIFFFNEIVILKQGKKALT